jgi:DNA repair photolyase
MNRQAAAAIKGRGAADSPQGRFERVNGYGREKSEDLPPGPEGAPRTTVTLVQARSIISRNESPDVPFTQSINPYQGCEHGCIYCYARPSHAYHDMSPGLDFETRILGKQNAAALLREELSRPGYRCELVALGANTDPYQPVEREQRITRGILEVLHEFRHPVGIVTKGALVERDIDILAAMAKEGLIEVHVSIGTFNAEVARTLEPRAAAPYRRLETIRRLAEAGIPVGVLTAPIIPFLNDGDMESTLARAWEAGARNAGYILVRLPFEVKALFRDWLEAHFPLKAAHVMSQINQMRGGRDNDPEFGSRMTGNGTYAQLLAQRFDKACRRIGFDRSPRHQRDTVRFSVPGKPIQLALF